MVLVDVDVQLLDALNSELFVRQRQHVGVGRKLVGIVYNGWRERSREQDCLDILWQKAAKISTTPASEKVSLTT